MLITNNDQFDFATNVRLENDLEKEKEKLKKIRKQLLDTKAQREFYAIFSISSLIIDNIFIKNVGFKEPTFAPITMTIYACFNTIWNSWINFSLKRQEPKILMNIEKITEKLKKLQEKDNLQELIILISLDNGKRLHEELQCILETYLQNEKIIDEKHLILKKD